MLPDPFSTQIARAARQHGLPIPLVTALVDVESEGNPWAARYESAFFERYINRSPIDAIPPCSILTEARLRATSLGLLQIMGAVARERGFDGVFLTALCDPEIGLEFGCRHLGWLAQRYQATFGWEGVVAAYNAGSPRKQRGGEWVNQAYVDDVRAAGGFA